MSVELRPHQLVATNDIDQLFAQGYRNVLSVLPTGAGKTLVKAEYARRCYQASQVCIAFAHRDVLLGQISDAMCMMGVPHSFICADKTRRDITNVNLNKFGDSFFNETSTVFVVSVPTFRARLKAGKISQQFLDAVSMWLMDESHHVTKGSTWGDSVTALRNAWGLGVTATPIRGDKKGLGSHADGVFDTMSVTTNMWALIQQGRLTPYKIFTPPTRIDLSGVNVTSGGDYNQKKLGGAVDKREITGDAVEHYLQIIPGKPVITFGVSIEHCEHVAKQFNDAGVPSKAVSSKSPEAERVQAVVDLREGRLLNLVNCDLFGEGFDAPSVTGVIMLRPTQSYSLYKQQFGRCLRPADGKSHGILLDHVGNTVFMMQNYGLTHPHDDPEWTLDRGTKRAKNDDGEKLDETMMCVECSYFWVVKEHGRKCPECGHDETEEEAENRVRDIQQLEGKLVELSVDAVDALIIERDRVDQPMEVFANSVRSLPGVARNSALNNHAKRLHAQTVLRHAVQAWCVETGERTGWSVDTVQREFNRVFGVHILKAQTLSSREAMELTEKVQRHEHA